MRLIRIVSRIAVSQKPPHGVAAVLLYPHHIPLCLREAGHRIGGIRKEAGSQGKDSVVRVKFRVANGYYDVRMRGIVKEPASITNVSAVTGSDSKELLFEAAKECKF